MYENSKKKKKTNIAGSAKTPICSAAGLVCLADTDWYNTSSIHDCMPLCEFSNYLLLPTQHYVSSFCYFYVKLLLLLEIFKHNVSIQHGMEHTRLLHLSIVFPKSRMVRDVVFSYAQMFGNRK